jgi:hypothetical protein
MPYRHGPSNQDLLANTPLWKGAVLCLAEAWPGNIPFAELASMARARAGMQQVTDVNLLQKEEFLLGKSILEMHLSGFVELHAEPSRFCTQMRDRPVASRLARRQAASGNRITNLRHEFVEVEGLARHLLPHLNGSNNRADLMRIASRLVDDGVVVLPAELRPGEADPGRQARLANGLDQSLDELARGALLQG